MYRLVRRSAAAPACLLLAAGGLTVAPAGPAGAATAASPVTVEARPSGQGWSLRDGLGREVALRGFNVSGSTKLSENALLPFRSTADELASWAAAAFR